MGPFQDCGVAHHSLNDWIAKHAAKDAAEHATFVVSTKGDPKDYVKDVSAAVPSSFVIKKAAKTASLRCFDVPKMKVATTTMTGCFSGLPAAWAAFMAKGKALGYKARWKVFIRGVRHESRTRAMIVRL